MRLGSFGFYDMDCRRFGTEAVKESLWLAIEALLVAFPFNTLMDLT